MIGVKQTNRIWQKDDVTMVVCIVFYTNKITKKVGTTTNTVVCGCVSVVAVVAVVAVVLLCCCAVVLLCCCTAVL